MARILFITSNRLGDAVLSTGVLARLLDDYPGAKVTVVCGTVSAGLFAGVPGLERIIPLTKQKYSLHWWKMWRASILKFWDVVVDLRNAPLSYALVARRHVHLGRAGKMDCHRVVSMASVFGWGDHPPAPHVWTLPAHEQNADALMPAGGPILALGPTSNWLGKTWAPQRFAELALRLTGPDGILPGARIAVMSHSSEQAMAQPVLDLLPADRTLNLVGNHDLLSVYACLGRSAFYVGNDSGLMHMAAASGTPTLGLFGPSREEHYGPWGENGMALRGPKKYEDVFPEHYDWRNAPCMMGDISVDLAANAAQDLWNRTK